MIAPQPMMMGPPPIMMPGMMPGMMPPQPMMMPGMMPSQPMMMPGMMPPPTAAPAPIVINT